MMRNWLARRNRSRGGLAALVLISAVGIAAASDSIESQVVAQSARFDLTAQTGSLGNGDGAVDASRATSAKGNAIDFKAFRNSHRSGAQVPAPKASAGGGASGLDAYIPMAMGFAGLGVCLAGVAAMSGAVMMAGVALLVGGIAFGLSPRYRKTTKLGQIIFGGK